MANVHMVVALQQENAKLRKQLNEHIDLKYALMKDKTELQDKYKKLEEEHREICDLDSELVDEKEELEEELEEVKRERDELKRERDELKREKAIQKLGGLKLCYN